MEDKIVKLENWVHCCADFLDEGKEVKVTTQWVTSDDVSLVFWCFLCSQ